MSGELKHILKTWLNGLLILTGLISFIAFIAVIGFYLNDYWFNFFRKAGEITVGIFVLQEIARWFLTSDKFGYAKTRILENTIAFIVLLQILFPYTVLEIISFVMPELSITELSLFFIALSQILVIFSIFIRTLRYNFFFVKVKLHSGSIIAISFILVILSGTLMLMLPRAVMAGNSIGFIDALFTSTSAVCVTGLTIADTSSFFSGIGKLIIISLIQIGGLGLMTITTFFAVIFAGGLSVRAKVFMKDLLSQDSVLEGVSLLKRILMFTFLVELAGSLLLYISLNGSFINFDKEIFYKCVFHSVSAFCNAGFSVYSDNLMFHTVQSNYFYLSVIMFLIVVGGMGFFTLTDVTRNLFRHKHKKRLRTSTKIILITTLILITAGMLLCFVFERNNTELVSTFDRLFHSLFLSVTARTAGFNSVSMNLISPASVMVLIILMWIGASPGSTGGGIKTTTFAVTVIALINFVRGKERIEVFHREIEPDSFRQSAMVIFSSLLFLGISTTLLVWLEPKLDPLDLIFEATSAISTVGLSRNLTPLLDTAGKIIITILMYVGRIGVFTFFLSLHKPKQEPRYRLPLEKIIIG